MKYDTRNSKAFFIYLDNVIYMVVKSIIGIFYGIGGFLCIETNIENVQLKYQRINICLHE